MKGTVDTTIHIRPSLNNIKAAQEAINTMPEGLHTHIIMISMTNFLVLSHDKNHKCFICHQTAEGNLKKE